MNAVVFSARGQRWCPPSSPSTSPRVAAPATRFRDQSRLNLQAHSAGTEGASSSAASCLLVDSKCSRKALKRVFKSYRKRLEQSSPSSTCTATSATLQACEASPVMSKLISELRELTLRLEQTSDLERFLPEDTSSGEDCLTRRTGVTSSPVSRCSSTSQLQVAGGLQVAAPVVDWDEDAYASMSFPGEGRILVCQGSKCRALGAGQVLAAVSALSANSPGVEVVPCKCVGKCKQGPAMRVRPQNQPCAVYTELTPTQLPEIFGTHFSEARVVEEQPAPDCCVECGTHPLTSSEQPATAALV